MKSGYLRSALVMCSLAPVCQASEEPLFIAGTTPWQRPEGAPVIEWVRHDQEWFRHALTGISPPYPKSLYFLDNQGHWYTPFNRPGMLPPYDIRGWHTKK